MSTCALAFWKKNSARKNLVNSKHVPMWSIPLADECHWLQVQKQQMHSNCSWFYMMHGLSCWPWNRNSPRKPVKYKHAPAGSNQLAATRLLKFGTFWNATQSSLQLYSVLYSFHCKHRMFNIWSHLWQQTLLASPLAKAGENGTESPSWLRLRWKVSSRNIWHMAKP